MFHFLASSSGPTLECQSLDMMLEILRLISSISSRYVVAIFTAPMSLLQNVLSSNVGEILPNSFLICPCLTALEFSTCFP